MDEDRDSIEIDVISEVNGILDDNIINAEQLYDLLELLAELEFENAEDYLSSSSTLISGIQPSILLIGNNEDIKAEMTDLTKSTIKDHFNRRKDVVERASRLRKAMIRVCKELEDINT